MPVTMRSNNRRQDLLASAAELFSKRGYQSATVREIAANCDMLSGSIYFHYANKEALLVAVYEEGVRQLTDRVRQSVVLLDDPWDRLHAMLTAHIEMIIEPTAYASVIIRILPDNVPAVEKELIELRNRYEVVFRDLVGALPLQEGVDLRVLRLLLIGAANHVHVWYRDGLTPPEDIAAQLVDMVRNTMPNAEEGANK